MSYNALIGKAFAYYDTLKEVDPSLVMNRDKYKVAEYIADLIYQNEDMNISDIIRIPFGYLLDWLYQFVGNYGVALIIFSLIVKIVLLPMNAKSKKSMLKMSHVAPWPRLSRPSTRMTSRSSSRN